MSVKSCKKRNINALDIPIQIKDNGYNILCGKKAEVINSATGGEPVIKRDCCASPEAVLGCTSPNVDDFIDILCDKADIIFDIGYVAQIETILVRSFFNPSTNYSVAEFELYASESKNELFCPEYKIAYENGIENWHKGERNNSDWVYDVEGSFRYLGIRVLKANTTDEIIRLSQVAVYSRKYSEGKLFIEENFPNNLLKKTTEECLTDGVIYNDCQTLKISGKRNFVFNIGSKKAELKLWIITCGNLKIDAGSEFRIDQVYEIKYGRKVHILNLIEKAKIDEISLTFDGNGQIDQIGAYSAEMEATVDFNDVIVKDCVGIGADLIPTALMPESIADGYNYVYWELEKCRIQKVSPHVIRLWFQPDWAVSEYEKYKNADFDFETDKMHALYEYLDIFKQVGTEIEFNFGWKIAEPAQEWFAFKDVLNRCASAPRELNLFAEACGKIMNELIVNRGYTNIKYITFFNESNCAEAKEQFWRYDFAVPDGILAREYYAEMLKLCKQSLQEYGLSKLEIWGFELTEKFEDWAKCAEKICGGIIDRYTFHRYFVESSNDSESLQATKGLFLKASSYTEKPVVMTECGQVYYPENYSFNMNHIQLFCDAINNGVSGMFIWCLNSVFITEPNNYIMRNGIDMWDAMQYSGGIENVRGSFYELAQLSRYIPNHCKAVKTGLITDNKDYRICGFKSETGDITVVVEADKGVGNRKIKISFDGIAKKTLYRHIYKRPCLMDGNALLPPVCGTIVAENGFTDNIDGDYQCIVYTTLPAIPQIAVARNEIVLVAGEKQRLSAAIIDGEGGIDWEITAKTNDAFKLYSFDSVAMIEAKSNATDGMAAIEVKSRKYPQIRNVIIAKIAQKG